MFVSFAFLLSIGLVFWVIRFLIQNKTTVFKRKALYLFIVIIVTIALLSFTYVFVGKKKTEDLMWEYLADKGYEQTEIHSIDVHHSFLNIILSYDEWSIKVVYADEPTSIYYYRIKNDEIVEGGIAGTTEKEDFKH